MSKAVINSRILRDTPTMLYQILSVYLLARNVTPDPHLQAVMSIVLPAQLQQIVNGLRQQKELYMAVLTTIVTVVEKPMIRIVIKEVRLQSTRVVATKKLRQLQIIHHHNPVLAKIKIQRQKRNQVNPRMIMSQQRPQLQRPLKQN
eukprot:NODE_202_length_14999_cov_0.270067.p9 type:complete len:146 gc:universal NODE_202_length_14999_cov_0.270067:4357-3920(-)